VRGLDASERIAAWKLMELQRHAMLMYTSCGWFFDELSGIETVQVIQYAGRAVQLAEELFGDQRERVFVEKLSHAKSNIPEHQDGARVYQKFVRPAFVDLRKVGAHYAIRSLFEPYEAETRIYQYKVEREAVLSLARGDKQEQQLAAGLARFTSEVTQESAVLGFAAFERGDFNPSGGVLKAASAEAFKTFVEKLKDVFSRGDTEELNRILQQEFEGEAYSLTVLFRDEQQRILNHIAESAWGEAEAAFGNLYPPLMSMIKTLVRIGGSLTIPRAFYAAAEFVLNTRLRRALGSEPLDFEGIRKLMGDAETANVSLDVATLEYTLRMSLERTAENLRTDPSQVQLIETLDAAVDLARSLPLEVNLAKTQNICYGLTQTAYRESLEKAQAGDENSKAWVDHFRALASKLSLHIG
jgi:hypothetical protein